MVIFSLLTFYEWGIFEYTVYFHPTRTVWYSYFFQDSGVCWCYYALLVNWGVSCLQTVTSRKILNNYEHYQKLAPAEGMVDSILQCTSLHKNVLLRSGIIKLWVASQSLAARSFNAIVNSKNKASFVIYKRWSKLLVLFGSQGQCNLRSWVVEKGTWLTLL
jgi:hypothetical protein